MPRKAKDEIIEEVSKEVTKKKTPVKKENKASAEKKVATKKESTKKETAKKTATTSEKTAKIDETKTVKGKKVTGTTKTEKKTDSAITKKGVNAEKKSSATTKKTATKKVKATKTTATKRKKKAVEDLEKLVDLEGNNVDLENEENEITEKVNIVEYYDLPYRYNQTVVKILAQTPNILFVYWDISDTDRNNFISQYGENFFNNTIPVLLIINKTMNYSYEIQINDFANSWYLHRNPCPWHRGSGYPPGPAERKRPWHPRSLRLPPAVQRARCAPPGWSGSPPQRCGGGYKSEHF